MSVPHIQIAKTPAQPRGLHARSKKMMTLFLLFLFSFAALAALLTIFLDPLQFYHKSSWYTPVFSQEERYQNPGLAKNYDYNNIIIGTSMTENFLPSQVDKTLGGTTMKLSMEGSTVDEHYKIAKLALGTGKVKQVLWGLDYFSLKLETTKAAKEFPDYLYDGKLWTDYKYWFNSSVYTQLFWPSLKSTLTGEPGKKLEYLNNWNGVVKFGQQYVTKAYLKASGNELYFGLNEENTDQLQAHFNTYILPLLKEYPDVQFYFYYPPYSVMRQVAWNSDNPIRFGNQLVMRKWMYEQFRQFDNVSLYDFQAESKWTFNLDLYKDLSHHSEEVNSWIAEAIGEKNPDYLVTDENIDEFNNKLQSQAESAVTDLSGNLYQSSVQFGGVQLGYTTRLIQGDKELWLTAKDLGPALGAKVEWDGTSKTVTLTSGGHSIAMTVGSSKALVDGTSTDLEAAPLLVGGKVLIPLAFTAEQLGWDVTTDNKGNWIRYSLTP
ncbi:hypothetical protein H70357_23970 [Paenibacillus sp. FSL H7-0357]|nr:hypothetical protein H70357_23970 [Paenibacillus sp. FSL H7-0357]